MEQKFEDLSPLNSLTFKNNAYIKAEILQSDCNKTNQLKELYNKNIANISLFNKSKFHTKDNDN